MSLIVGAGVVNVWNLSSGLKEKSTIACDAKAVSINHFIDKTIGVVDCKDSMTLYSSVGDVQCVISMKKNTNCIAFMKNSTLVAGNSSGCIQIYEKGSLIKIIQHTKDSISEMKPSKGRRLLYCRHENGAMSTFNSLTDETVSIDFKEKVNTFDASRFSSNITLFGSKNGVVRFDNESKKVIGTFPSDSPIASIAFSNSNKLLAASVSEKRKLSFYGCDTNKVIYSLNLDNVPTKCVFDNDNLLAVGDELGTVSIYDMRTKKVMASCQQSNKIEFVGFNDSDIVKEFSNMSSKSSVLKEIQNVSNKSKSNNSLFSGDDSYEPNAVIQDSIRYNYDSSFNEDNLPPISITETKRSPAQVKFQRSPKSETRVTDTRFKQEMVPASKNTDLFGDIIGMRKMISEEINKAITPLEYRIKNDIIFGVIDQLGITEDNIVTQLLSALDNNKLLMEENEDLRRQLRFYKYNM